MANRIYNIYRREVKVGFSVPDQNSLQNVTLLLQDISRANSELTEYYKTTEHGEVYFYIWKSIDVVSLYPPVDIHNSCFSYVYKDNTVIGLSCFLKKTTPLKVVIDNTWNLHKCIPSSHLDTIKDTVFKYINSLNFDITTAPLDINSLSYSFSDDSIQFDYYKIFTSGISLSDIPKSISTYTLQLLQDFISGNNTTILFSTKTASIDIFIDIDIESLSIAYTESYDVILKYYVKPGNNLLYEGFTEKVLTEHKKNSVFQNSVKVDLSVCPKEYVLQNTITHEPQYDQHLITRDLNTPYNYGVFNNTLATINNNKLILRSFCLDTDTITKEVIPVPINTIIGDGCYVYTTGETLIVGSFGLAKNSQYTIRLASFEPHSICMSKKAKDDQLIDFSEDIAFSIVASESNFKVVTLVISIVSNKVYINIIQPCSPSSDQINYVASIGTEYIIDSLKIVRILDKDVYKYQPLIRYRSIEKINYQSNLKLLSHSGKLIKLSIDLQNILVIPKYNFYGYLAQFYFFNKPYTFLRDTLRSYKLQSFKFDN